MARSFTSHDLIQLPRLRAPEAAVLITELLTAAPAALKEAKLKELPPAIERSRKRLSAAHAELDDSITPKAPGDLDTQAARRADRTIDTAWSAVFDWLSGWCKLPADKNPHAGDALALFALIFPEALGFTKLSYKVEWQESKSRLDAIARDGHEKTFKQLGGAMFLTNLHEAHEAYGHALHITSPRPESAPPPDVRLKLDAARAALRDYATRVAAYADPEVPGSEALAEALLLPLARWESSHTSHPSRGETPGDEAGGTTPGPSPAPEG